jgi:hypothetical protein
MKRILIIVIALGVTVVVLLGWGMFGDHSSFQTGLVKYEGLPAAASDITVYQNRNISGAYVADFKISEPDFVSFAREKHWDVQPIAGPVSVFQAKAFHDRRPNDKKEITDGLFYSQRTANGGGITTAYDRRSGRAYVDSSSR